MQLSLRQHSFHWGSIAGNSMAGPVPAHQAPKFLVSLWALQAGELHVG